MEKWYEGKSQPSLVTCCWCPSEPGSPGLNGVSKIVSLNGSPALPGELQAHSDFILPLLGWLPVSVTSTLRRAPCLGFNAAVIILKFLVIFSLNTCVASDT